MPAILSTITVLDGNAVPIQVRVVDSSGTGLGPFSTGNTIKDGEGVASVAAVKGPSTSPGATDPSLVVALSPNSAATPVTQSGTWNVANTGTFVVQAAQSGTWNARIQDSTGTGITVGAGAADSHTLRATIDTGQMGSLG